MWDNVEEFDFRWDTAHLDCRFSIGLEEARWRIRVGINHHSKDDECFMDGVGGEEIEGNDSFACEFFDGMKWEIATCGRK